MQNLPIKPIVGVNDNIITTTSMNIAEVFGKRHDHVLRALDKLVEDIKNSGEDHLPNFGETVFSRKNPSGGAPIESRMFNVTRDGFTLLVMGFTGEKALKFKLAYIKAFNMMERELLKQKDNLEWKQARQQSKTVRRDVTDTIKRFVEYATLQGSKSAEMYYGNITKMEYKALGLIVNSEKQKASFRDTLDLMDLCFLQVAEQIAKQSLEAGMERGSYYKDIYVFAKERVMAYAETVKLPLLQKTSP